MRPSTKLVHGHRYFDERYGTFLPPIYQVAMFEQPDRETGETRLTDRGTELKYSREENPTVRALEHALAAVEESEDALAFSCGMGAISTLFIALLKQGSRLLVTAEAYGVTLQLAGELSKFGVKTLKMWPSAEAFAEQVREGDVVFVETVTNPTLKVIDVVEVARNCRDAGATLIVDNTFASPVVFKPATLARTIVVESLTKYVAGHNDVLGGCVAGNADPLKDIWDWRRKMGTIMNPFEAFLTLRGLKTLEIRFERVSRTALEIAEFLQDHPKIEEVLYPGLDSNPYKQIADKIFQRRLYGGVLSFKVKGGKSEVKKVLSKVRIIKPAPSLGGTESLLTYPVISAAKMLPEDERLRLGITDNLLRLSVGLEDTEDLKEDLGEALA